MVNDASRDGPAARNGAFRRPRAARSFFGPPLLGDVSGEDRIQGRLAPLERRHHEFDQPLLTVVPAGRCFLAGVEFGCRFPPQRTIRLERTKGVRCVRYEQIDALRDRLVGRVAEERFGRRVEFDDAAPCVDGDHGIERCAKHGRLPRFRSLQGPLGCPTLTDVAEYEHDADDATRFVANGSRTVIDRSLRAVLRDEYGVICQPDDRSSRRRATRDSRPVFASAR